MQLVISLTDGRWLVNKKPLNELNKEERDFMNGFFKALKRNPEGVKNESLTKPNH